MATRVTDGAWREKYEKRETTRKAGEMRPSYASLSGSVFNVFVFGRRDFPTVLQPSSTCQWLRLLTACCQRFTNQPIVFCIVRPTLNSLALAKRAVSLFLAYGWRSHAMGFWRHSNGTRSLTHSLTHSILINLSIKVRLNRLLLPPLLSITFVPSGFYVYFWNILEGTSKANFFFPTHQL